MAFRLDKMCGSYLAPPAHSILVYRDQHEKLRPTSPTVIKAYESRKNKTEQEK